MILAELGDWKFVRHFNDEAFEPFASASSMGPAVIEVYRGGQLIDKVYLSGPTHTWWNSNPLFRPDLKDGEQILIRLRGPAGTAMRIEYPGLTLLDS